MDPHSNTGCHSNDWKVKSGIPDRKLFQTLARNIVKHWKKLGRALDLDEKILDEIEEEEKRPYERAFKTLISWSESKGSEATFDALEKGLLFETVGRTDLAMKYCYEKQGSNTSPTYELQVDLSSNVGKKKTIEGSSDSADSGECLVGAENQSQGELGLSYEAYSVATNKFAEKLEEGGEGEVFKGSLKGGLKIAVKTIRSSTSLEREKKMTRCRNPFILPVWDVVKSSNPEVEPHLVVYPYMSNGNLYEAIVKKQKTISYQKRITIALNVVHSLIYLHSNGFVYRDFKSSNILLDDYMNPRLGDYGVVNEVPKDDTASETDGTTTTKLGTVKPENGLWGLGVVLFELLFGKSGSSSKGISLPTEMIEYDNLCNASDAVKKIRETEEYKNWMKEQGWPDPNEQKVTVEFLHLACRCLSLKERISLDKLSSLLKELATKADFTPFFNEPENLDYAICVYCLKKQRTNQSMPCGHMVACGECPGKSESLVCPHCCMEHYLRFGNPSSCALIISGRGIMKAVNGVQPDMLVFKKDAEEVANVLENNLNFRENRVHLITPETACNTSKENIYDTVDLIKLQFDDDREKSKSSVSELNLFVFISGHFDKHGNFVTKADEKLIGNDFLDKLKELKADNILMFLMGCYSESFFTVSPQTVHRSKRSDSAEEYVADESPKTKHSGIALKNLIAYCSSPAQETSTFKMPNKGNKKKVDTSLFTTFLINALRGAQECGSLYNDSNHGKINASGCEACAPLRQTLRQLKVVEVNDVVSYIRDHMKLNIKDEKCLPKVIFSGDGRKFYLLFATEEEGRI